MAPEAQPVDQSVSTSVSGVVGHFDIDVQLARPVGIDPAPNLSHTSARSRNIADGWRGLLTKGLAVVTTFTAGGAALALAQTEPEPGTDPSCASPSPSASLELKSVIPSASPSLTPNPDGSFTVFSPAPTTEAPASPFVPRASGSPAAASGGPDGSTGPIIPAVDVPPTPPAVDPNCKSPEPTQALTLKQIMKEIENQPDKYNKKTKEGIKKVDFADVRRAALDFWKQHLDVLSTFKSDWDSAPVTEEVLADLFSYMKNGDPNVQGQPDETVELSKANGYAGMTVLFGAASRRMTTPEDQQLALDIADMVYDNGAQTLKVTYNKVNVDDNREQMNIGIAIAVKFFEPQV